MKWRVFCAAFGGSPTGNWIVFSPAGNFYYFDNFEQIRKRFCNRKVVHLMSDKKTMLRCQSTCQSNTGFFQCDKDSGHGDEHVAHLLRGDHRWANSVPMTDTPKTQKEAVLPEDCELPSDREAARFIRDHFNGPPSEQAESFSRRMCIAERLLSIRTAQRDEALTKLVARDEELESIKCEIAAQTKELATETWSNANGFNDCVRLLGAQITRIIADRHELKLVAHDELRLAILEVLPHLNELPKETYQRLAPICHSALAALPVATEGEKELCRYTGNPLVDCNCVDGCKTNRMEAGEWTQPVVDGYRMICCDCGMAHLMNFRIHDGKIQFQAFRDAATRVTQPKVGGGEADRILRAMVADEAFADLCAGIGEEPQWLKDARKVLVHE